MDLDAIVGQLAAPAIGRLLEGRPAGDPVARGDVQALVWTLTRAIGPPWRRMRVRQALFIAVMSYLRSARTSDHVVVGYEVDLGGGFRADLVLESTAVDRPRSYLLNELKLSAGPVLTARAMRQLEAHLRLGHAMFGDAFAGVRLTSLGDRRWSREFPCERSAR